MVNKCKKTRKVIEGLRYLLGYLIRQALPIKTITIIIASDNPKSVEPPPPSIGIMKYAENECCKQETSSSTCLFCRSDSAHNKKAIIATIANGILITPHPIIVVIKWRIPVPSLNSSAILKRSGIAFLSNPIKRPRNKTILEITKPIKKLLSFLPKKRSI